MSGGQGSQGGYGGSQSGYGGYGMRPIGYGSSTGYQRQMSAPSMQSQSGYGGYIPPQMPIFPGPTTTSEGGWATAGRPRGGIPPVGGQFNPMVGSQMNQPAPQMSTGYQVKAPAPNAPTNSQSGGLLNIQPQQSFEQFAQTLNGSGMTSGQISDLYAKQQAQAQSAPAQTNFWGNVGPGGTQNPFPQSPQPFPSQWGNQTFNFDPKAMAGKQVTGDLGWYYGRDAIGRQINNQGDAVAGFSSPADGFQRSRPWFG